MAKDPSELSSEKYPKTFSSGQGGGSADFMLPYKMNSGTMRGTQNVGTGPKIDSANNRITLTNSVDGSSVGIGTIPGSTTNEFGFFSLDSSGNVVMKIVNGTWYVYDLSSGKNVMQTGKLPDSTYGWAVAASGKNVSEGF